MSMSQAAMSAAPEVCRITVNGPDGRADVAVPESMPLVALIPVLLQGTGLADGDVDDGRWVLQKLGEEPLDLDGTSNSLGLRHGDILWLRKAEEAMAAIQYDDVADGVAQAIGGRNDRWVPEWTRRLSLVGASIVLVASAISLLTTGLGTATASESGFIALLLVGGCVAGSRMHVHASITVAAAIGALVFGALAGLGSRAGDSFTDLPGTGQILLAGGWVLIVGAALWASRAVPLVIPGTALLGALEVGVCCVLSSAIGLGGRRAIVCTAVLVFAFGNLGPRVALRLGRLRVPLLPHNAAELQEDTDPLPAQPLATRVAVAGAFLDAFSVSASAMYLAAWWSLGGEAGVLGWLFPTVFASAILLRARQLNGVTQRVSTTVAGLAGLVGLLIGLSDDHGPATQFTVLVILVTGAVALLVAAEWLPRRRLLPIWGHIGDIAEWITVIALLPLLLQMLHAYSSIRSATG
ncbi:type VII secretion integral membrane protein EccD [Streptomyces sp. NPDC054775]